ncbi:hypothetical protein WA026_014966, partial [Henosepilachna vigintioctopunctata]
IYAEYAPSHSTGAFENFPFAKKHFLANLPGSRVEFIGFHPSVSRRTMHLNRRLNKMPRETPSRSDAVKAPQCAEEYSVS